MEKKLVDPFLRAVRVQKRKSALLSGSASRRTHLSLPRAVASFRVPAPHLFSFVVPFNLVAGGERKSKGLRQAKRGTHDVARGVALGEQEPSNQERRL